tara:strand:+ start:685 stop:861 length:177 start_codon:yes stop_codon:yes gene_type:complete
VRRHEILKSIDFQFFDQTGKVGALDFKNFGGFGTIPRGGLQSAHYKGPPEGIAGVLKC